MNDESPAEFNPYQAPMQPSFVEPESLDAWPAKVRRFHSESRALAGAIVFFGVIGVMITVTVISSGDANLLGSYAIGFGAGCLFSVCAIVVGFGIGMKKLNAIRTGLGILYLTPLVLAVMFPSAVGAMIALGYIALALVIAQAHRVLGWAIDMEAAGIPLTTRHEQVSSLIINWHDEELPDPT